MTNEQLAAASGGDMDACKFLLKFSQYLPAIAALAHREKEDPKGFVDLLAETNLVYSMPFYSRNAGMLLLPVMGAISRAADGNPQLGIEEVVFAVSVLKNGYEKTRKLQLDNRAEQAHRTDCNAVT